MDVALELSGWFRDGARAPPRPSNGSERGLVGRDARRCPRVAGRGTALAATRRCSALRRGSRCGPRVVVGRGGLAALLSAVRRATLPLRPRHLGGGVLQGRADLVDLDLEHRALLALARLVLPRAEAALDDPAQPLLQRLRDVLCGLPPHRAGQEQRVAVLPLVGLLVEGARRRG